MTTHALAEVTHACFVSLVVAAVGSGHVIIAWKLQNAVTYVFEIFVLLAYMTVVVGSAPYLLTWRLRGAAKTRKKDTPYHWRTSWSASWSYGGMTTSVTRSVAKGDSDK